MSRLPPDARQRAIIAVGRVVKRQALAIGFSNTLAVVAIVLVLAAVAITPTGKARVTAAGARTNCNARP
jgi:DHA2 family multidrug resistance protein